MLEHTNADTTNDVDEQDQQAGNCIATNKLGRTIHGTVEVRFVRHLFAALARGFLVDQACI